MLGRQKTPNVVSLRCFLFLTQLVIDIPYSLHLFHSDLLFLNAIDGDTILSVTGFT